jgi:hypothetical protein
MVLESLSLQKIAWPLWCLKVAYVLLSPMVMDNVIISSNIIKWRHTYTDRWYLKPIFLYKIRLFLQTTSFEIIFHSLSCISLVLLDVICIDFGYGLRLQQLMPGSCRIWVLPWSAVYRQCLQVLSHVVVSIVSLDILLQNSGWLPLDNTASYPRSWNCSVKIICHCNDTQSPRVSSTYRMLWQAMSDVLIV